jgi:ubiquitin carboxyl-terminal hydrolase L5
LVFLFQWIRQNQQDHARSKEPLAESAIPESLFFAHQVTTNACATQALLSVVLNAASLSPESLGPTLSEFKSFTESFPPNLKGVAISSSEEIRNTHNSFRAPDFFLNDTKISLDDSDKGEAYHFVAYVPHDGVVYELDGLMPGPIALGSIDNDNNTDNAWLSLARAAVEERMQQGGDHIKFNLMAVMQDKREQLQLELAALDENDALYHDKLSELAQEEHKRELWKLENQRRRHNYVPLCMQLLKELAQQGSLMQLADEAKEREAARRAAQQMNKG